MPADPSPAPEPDPEPDAAVDPVPPPANRAERRSRKKDPTGGAVRQRGTTGHSGPAFPGAQGRKVNPIRRSG